MITSKSFILAAIAMLITFSGFSQCGNDPTSGTFTISSAGQIVNSYFAGTGNPTATSTSLTVGAIDARGSSTSLATGDLVLIVQMQGADINTSNSDAFGDGIIGGNASGYLSANLYSGYYEYNTIASFAASVITFSYPLANSYYTRAFGSGNSSRKYQVIRVPRNYNLTIDAGASATAPSWNGITGGIVVLDAANTLTINGSVNAVALGFRGGGGKNFTGAAAGNTNGSSTLVNTDYRWNSPLATAENTTGGMMGEGIAGTPAYVLPQNAVATVINAAEGYINGSMGRGAPGNAGGGATDGAPVGSGNNQYNSGGGGGSNAGAGGRGGSGWHSGSGTSATYPYGGFGGSSFTQNSISRFIMGGGGGAGTANNSNSTNEYQSSGGCGGGMIIIRAKQYAGTGNIQADGGDAPGVVGVGGTSNTDAAGGGGAGGTIVVVTRQTVANGLGSVTASAKGGKGGDMSNYYDHGPGGGGGGGIIYTNGTFASTNVSGAANGKTRTGSTSGAMTNDFGSTAGSNGQVVSYASTPILVGSNNLSAPCGILPVTLLSFYGVVKSGMVTVFWQVERALNFHHFEVEYSSNASSFIAAGTVNYNAGNSSYQFNHPVNGSPVIYYRLKMHDIDGSYSYSRVIMLRIAKDKETALLFPNPARTETTLQLFSAVNEAALLTVIDAAGKQLIRQPVMVNNGNNFFPIACNKLSAGYYMVHISTNSGISINQKLMIAGSK